MSNKGFNEYLAESAKEYTYTLKFAVESVGDKMVDQLEAALGRYELVSASKFTSTPIQQNPLDFPNVRNTPVFISTIKTKYPASRDFLRTFIGNSLGLSESLIAVYSENDPREIETQLHLERSDPDYVKNYKARLGDDYSEYSVPEGLSTEDQRLTLLKELAADRADREVDIVALAETDPNGHDDTFNDNIPEASLGLFGRIKPTTLRSA